MRHSLIPITMTLVFAQAALAQTPLGSGFTYQGRLDLAGSPVHDTADFEFTLWDAATGGVMIGSPVAATDVAVVDGLFTVELDFGVLVFNGDARWLEIAVRSPAGSGAFATLDPRQPVTATPYAMQTRGINVDDQGTVAANAFVGDGSGLTNLPTQNGPWEISGSDIHYDAGNVGVGTDAPTAALHVLGGNQTPSSHLRVEVDDTAPWGAFFSLDAEATAGGKEYLIFSTGGSAGEGQGKLVIRNHTDSVRAITIDPSGDLDVPSGDLDVNGTVTATAFVGERIGHGLQNIRFDNGILLGSTDLFIDQRLEFGGGISWPSTDVWQSFTAGVTGELGAVDLRRYSGGAAGTVTIYEGEGVGAAILGGGSMPAQPVDGWQEVVLSSPIPLTSGQMYTIRVRSGRDNWFSNVATFPTPTYSGGRSSLGPQVDYYFRTKMLQGSGDTMIVHNGRVGIGTATPTRGLVDIEGFVSRALGPHGFLSLPGITGGSPGTTPANYSLYASHRIAARTFNAHSDARIKNVAGLSNHDADLETLMAIEVTDYTMVDTVTNGADAYKKVIGQQVREAYPQAVVLSTDVVPDIYQSASVEDGWILLATNLEAGDRVKLITEERARVHDVLEVHADRFRVENSPSGRVFVYGREVDDFHNVDYEAIAMLNVSATQALHRRIAEQDVEIAELRAEKDSEIKALTDRLATLEAFIAESARN